MALIVSSFNIFFFTSSALGPFLSKISVRGVIKGCLLQVIHMRLEIHAGLAICYWHDAWCLGEYHHLRICFVEISAC
jgi:hypothetical protein